jgi:hypothetical protein
LILFVAGCICFGFGCRPSQILTFCKGIGEYDPSSTSNIYCNIIDIWTAKLKKKGGKFVIDIKKDDLKTKKANGYIIDDNYIAELVKVPVGRKKEIPGIMGLRWGGFGAAVFGLCIWVFQPQQ